MDHVQMALHHHRSHILFASGCRFADDNITNGINDGFQTKILSELFHKRNNALFLLRRTRYCVQLFKTGPDFGWVEGGNFLIHPEFSLSFSMLSTELADGSYLLRFL